MVSHLWLCGSFSHLICHAMLPKDDKEIAVKF